MWVTLSVCDDIERPRMGLVWAGGEQGQAYHTWRDARGDAQGPLGYRLVEVRGG